MPDFAEHPGLLFVVATLVPLASFTLLLLAGALRNFLRSQKSAGGPAEALFELMGGEATGRGPAWIATAAIMLSCACCVVGLVQFLGEHGAMHAQVAANTAKILQLEIQEASRKKGGADHPAGEHKDDAKKGKEPHDDEHGHGGHGEADKLRHENHELEEAFEERWSDRITWAKLSYRDAKVAPRHVKDTDHGTVLELGYRIDHLSAIMFVMVTFIASLIHLFSIGYMSDELQEVVEDHEVNTDHGHYHRRGRFGRFFLYLSLFCFSMLNLVLADNLFQIFLSWELVGICSYLLIGHYYERTSASNAANKAFITNRIGDAGFIIGLLILWTTVGTLNFQEIFARFRAPEEVHAHGHAEKISSANKMFRGNLVDGKNGARIFNLIQREATR